MLSFVKSFRNRLRQKAKKPSKRPTISTSEKILTPGRHGSSTTIKRALHCRNLIRLAMDQADPQEASQMLRLASHYLAALIGEADQAVAEEEKRRQLQLQLEASVRAADGPPH